MTSSRQVPFTSPRQWLPSECEAWSTAAHPGDVLYDGGPASEWAESTRKRSERYYGNLVYYYDKISGLPPAQNVSDRICKEALGDYVDYRLDDVDDRSLAVELRRIAAVAGILDPKADRSLLNRASTKLARRHRRRAEPNVPLVDPPSCLRKALAIMDTIECNLNGSEKWGGTEMAIQYTSSLLVAFWTLCPLRPINMASMQRSVHFEGWGLGSRISFASHEMKERRDFSVPIAPIIAGPFEKYWQVYRAALVPEEIDHDYVWVAEAGRPLSPQGASRIVARFTETHFGVRMTGHKLRHAAASYIVEQRPESAGVAAGALGHAEFSMTKKFYIKGQQYAASRLYAQCVDDVIAAGPCKRNSIGADL